MLKSHKESIKKYPSLLGIELDSVIKSREFIIKADQTQIMKLKFDLNPKRNLIVTRIDGFNDVYQMTLSNDYGLLFVLKFAISLLNSILNYFFQMNFISFHFFRG